MAIDPDTKDWTWVIERPCPECGFVAAEVQREDVGDLIRAQAAQWQEVLRRPDAELRQRPDDSTWSPLEYACHVRDVFALYDQRLELMLTRDDPTYPNWDQDATAVEERYGEQDPKDVAPALAAAAADLAERFDDLAEADWERTGTRSDGARFTVERFARYLLHDPAHHLWDVSAMTPGAP